MLPPRISPPKTTIRQKLKTGTWLKFFPRSRKLAVRPVNALDSHSSNQPDNFCSGRIRQASTRAMGYSTVPAKSKGAKRALKTPPTMPPTDIHRKNSVRCLVDGLSRASSPWQTKAVKKNAIKVRLVERHS